MIPNARPTIFPGDGKADTPNIGGDQKKFTNVADFLGAPREE